MNTYWKTSSVGAELIEANPENPKDEKVLGAVLVDHGYCFHWAKNTHGITVNLQCRFSEHLEKSKADVQTYLIDRGILPPVPPVTPVTADENAA